MTRYSYTAAGRAAADARNIGWLTEGVDFPKTAKLDLRFLDRLWRFCKVSIAQTRGLHQCELCRSGEANIARRDAEELLLGSAEIRVVSTQDQLFAAPNLIFHYVVGHNYSPPHDFVEAVLTGPCPPAHAFYDQLSMLGIEWRNTLIPEPGGKPFKFVKTPDGIVKVEE